MQLGMQVNVMFNTPINECWRFTLKRQMRLLPHKRIKNVKAMLFYVTAAGTDMFIKYRTEYSRMRIHKSFNNF